MSRRPGGAQSAPSWQRSILAVNLFLLARGGVAAGLVVQATRNHATDSEQEEGDGQHWSSCAASRVAPCARAAVRVQFVRADYLLTASSPSTVRETRPHTCAPACGRVCRNKM